MGIHDPNAEEGHKLFLKNKRHTRDGKGNSCTSVFADPTLVRWVTGDNEEDEEDLKKYTEQKMKKQKKSEQAKNDDNEQNEDDDQEDEEDDYRNYQMYSGKSQSDDEKDLFCPNEKCKSKLGSKQWQGTQCSCGAWVIPAFKILLSKVDAIPLKDEDLQQEGKNTSE